MKVDVHWFLRDANRFPWGIFGIDYPGVGTLCSYVCRAALVFADPNQRKYLNGAMLSELQRFYRADEGNFFLAGIVSFLESAGQPDTRQARAELLVQWLSHQDPFIKKLQKELDTLYKRGVLSVSKEALRDP